MWVHLAHLPISHQRSPFADLSTEKKLRILNFSNEKIMTTYTTYRGKSLALRGMLWVRFVAFLLWHPLLLGHEHLHVNYSCEAARQRRQEMLPYEQTPLIPSGERALSPEEEQEYMRRMRGAGVNYFELPLTSEDATAPVSSLEEAAAQMQREVRRAACMEMVEGPQGPGVASELSDIIAENFYMLLPAAGEFAHLRDEIFACARAHPLVSPKSAFLSPASISPHNSHTMSHSGRSRNPSSLSQHDINVGTVNELTVLLDAVFEATNRADGVYGTYLLAEPTIAQLAEKGLIVPANNMLYPSNEGHRTMFKLERAIFHCIDDVLRVAFGNPIARDVIMQEFKSAHRVIA